MMNLQYSPDVYASALLLSGFKPEMVEKILRTQGLETSMSIDDMLEVKSLRLAVISEELQKNVVLANRVIKMGLINKKGFIVESAIDRLRRILFTKKFASKIVRSTNPRESIAQALFELQPSRVEGQSLTMKMAKAIVNSLSDEEIRVIDGNAKEIEYKVPKD